MASMRPGSPKNRTTWRDREETGSCGDARRVARHLSGCWRKDVRQPVGDGVDLLLSGAAPETEADGAHAHLRRHAHRFQHWRRLDMAGMAGGTRRSGNAIEPGK